MEFAIALKTDIGPMTSVNQDSMYVCTAKWQGENYVFAVVCDGMGGLSDGEKASRAAAEAMGDWFENGFADWMSRGGRESTLCAMWMGVLERCNAQLILRGRENGARMGTTLTAMLMGPEWYVIVHVGDTRAYEIGRQLRQITRDHTLATRMVESGVISRAEARTTKENHVLTRCLGVEEPLDPAFYFGTTERNAVYLLCSDGFRNRMEDQELREAFSPENCPDAVELLRACQLWVKTCRERGEEDNISAAVIRTVPTSDPRKKRVSMDATITDEDVPPMRGLDETMPEA